jgi:xanthosine utilization system XapX-like protein
MAIEAVHQGEHGPMRLTGEILAGVGCGLLVGVVLALIDVSVIGSISVVIAAIVGAMIGVSKPQWIQAEYSNTRIAAFGISAALAFAGGVALKENHYFSPSVKSETARFTDAGFSEQASRDLALYSLFKLVPKDRTLGQ